MTTKEARRVVRRARMPVLVSVALDGKRSMCVQVSKRQLLSALGRHHGKTVEVVELWGALVVGM